MEPREPPPDAPEADETLLRAFFRSELGGELPPLASRRAPRRRRQAVLVVAGAAAAALLAVVVWRVWPGSAATPELRFQELLLTKTLEPIERVTYRGATGRVVEETRLRRTTIRLADPVTGDCLEWSVPELRIEIRPVGGPEEEGGEAKARTGRRR